VILQLKPDSGSGQGETLLPSGGEKTNYATEQQQQVTTEAAAAAAPALSFAFNICPPSPESSPAREYFPGIAHQCI